MENPMDSIIVQELRERTQQQSKVIAMLRVWVDSAPPPSYLDWLFHRGDYIKRPPREMFGEEKGD